MSIGQNFPAIGPTWWVVILGPASTQLAHTHASVVGPMTQAQFTARYGSPDNTLNPPGGFTSQAAAQAAAAKYNTNPQQSGVQSPGAAPGINAPNPLGTNPFTGLNAIGDFFQRLTQASTWVRVGEFVAGGILIYVGAKAFFPSAVNTTIKYAKRAGKVAIK